MAVHAGEDRTKHHGAVSVPIYPASLYAFSDADEGIAIIPSFGMAACRNRQVVMSPLVDPVVSMDFHQITQRGRNLPEGADEFLAFLMRHVSDWAEHAGVV